MADQTPIDISDAQQDTLFDVEVPKHVNMQFLYAALQAAQARAVTQDAAITSLQKQVRTLFAKLSESKPNGQELLTVADMVGETKAKPAPRKFLCTTESIGDDKVYHNKAEQANNHLSLARQAERDRRRYHASLTAEAAQQSE